MFTEEVERQRRLLSCVVEKVGEEVHMPLPNELTVDLVAEVDGCWPGNVTPDEPDFLGFAWHQLGKELVFAP